MPHMHGTGKDWKNEDTAAGVGIGRRPCCAQKNDDELIGTGKSFYSNCESVETFKEGQEKTAQVKAAYCLGFVEGLRLGIVATETSTWNKAFCQPDDITNLQTVRIVRKYGSTLQKTLKGLKNPPPAWQSNLFT